MQGGELGLGLGLAKLMEPWKTLRCRDALWGLIYHYSPSLFSAAFFFLFVGSDQGTDFQSEASYLHADVWVRSSPEGWEPICPLLNTQIREQSHCKAVLPTCAETTRPSRRSCCMQPLSAARGFLLQSAVCGRASCWHLVRWCPSISRCHLAQSRVSAQGINPA